ncbi:MAG TPA: bifunctional RNase H/acid phosphatase [Mycobacteriales bacterium]|nr:bifunctional RNase H/acid phosphatase [Mycobacteriales bacterium]
MSAPVRLIVEADGGSRGNPGPAGYGAVVRDASDGQILIEVAESIGRATNNVAEYRGLLAGLSSAAQFSGAEALEVRMDSKLVVEQMSGRWRVKHPDLQPLHARARELAEQFPAVSFTWVPRKRNAEADRLANEAMDAAAKGQTWQPKQTEAEPRPEEPEPEVRWTAATGTPTTTVLLRHGQTVHSIGGLFSGRNDLKLTNAGIAQAEAAAKHLAGEEFDRILTSPLVRSRQTAEIVQRALRVPVDVEDGLIECDFGEWEGYSLKEVSDRWPDELAAWRESPRSAPPGGESFAAMTERVDAARKRIQRDYAGQKLLLVSHVGPIKGLLQVALEATPALMFRLHLDIASISTILWYDNGQASVRLVNDTHHWAD